MTRSSWAGGQAVVCFALMVVLLVGLGAAAARVWTADFNYGPGDLVTILGEDFTAGSTVVLTVSGCGTSTYEVLVTEAGTFTQGFTAQGCHEYVVEAIDSNGVSATWTFTDSAAVSVTFATDSPCSVTVSGSYWSNGGHYTPFTGSSTSFLVNTLTGTNVSYTYQDSVTCGGTVYNYVSASPSSPFTTGAAGVRMTVSGHYAPACTAPSITMQPSGATKTVGESVTFSVTASGTTPLSYQWHKGDTHVGGNSTTYTIASVLTSDAGTYTVEVSNACGNRVSDVATLVVNKASATVTLGDLTQTYTGSPLSPTATTDPEGLALVWTGVPQTDAGHYPMSVAVDDPNYEGSTTNAFTIDKADAAVTVSGYTGVYDGDEHGASGTATGVGGAHLSGLDLGLKYIDVPGGTAHWTFSYANYNGQSGDVGIEITPANASVLVNGYTGVYDAASHGASLDHATGVGGVNLSSGVSLGDTFTNVPSGTAHWTFSYANYNGQSGDVGIEINKADTTTTITGDTPNPSVIGQAYTVTSSVTVNDPGDGTPTGLVKVSDGTDSVTAAVGAGTCTLVSKTLGAKTLVATYAGDANFNGSVSAGVPHLVYARFIGLLEPYKNGLVAKINSSIPFKWQYADSSGAILNSSSAAPVVRIFKSPVVDINNLPVTAEFFVNDPGASGQRYDVTSNTWQFNWQTKKLDPGSYYVYITCSSTAWQAAGPFGIVLRK